MQKREKVSFGVSVVCRSMKKFHLVFLSCAEARKSFIWRFCRVQKHEKVSFGLSEMFRSMKKQNKFMMLLIYFYCCSIKCVLLPMLLKFYSRNKGNKKGWNPREDFGP